MTRRRLTTCANADCRRPCHPQARGLCDPCLKQYRRDHDRARIGTRERSHYSGAWRERSKREIAAHVATYGYVCPRCDTADPETNPLSLDHVKARDESETMVMCRRCNSRKGSR